MASPALPEFTRTIRFPRIPPEELPILEMLSFDASAQSYRAGDAKITVLCTYRVRFRWPQRELALARWEDDGGAGLRTAP